MPFVFRARCPCDSYSAKPKTAVPSPELNKRMLDKLKDMILQHSTEKMCTGTGLPLEEDAIWCQDWDNNEEVRWTYAEDLRQPSTTTAQPRGFPAAKASQGSPPAGSSPPPGPPPGQPPACSSPPPPPRPTGAPSSKPPHMPGPQPAKSKPAGYNLAAGKAGTPKARQTARPPSLSQQELLERLGDASIIELTKAWIDATDPSPVELAELNAVTVNALQSSLREWIHEC